MSKVHFHDKFSKNNFFVCQSSYKLDERITLFFFFSNFSANFSHMLSTLRFFINLSPGVISFAGKGLCSVSVCVHCDTMLAQV